MLLFRASLPRPENHKAARMSFLIRYQTHQRCYGDLLVTGPAISLVARQVGIMAIPIEDRESEHAAQNLKQLLWGEVIF